MENQRRMKELHIEIQKQKLELNKSAEVRQQKFEEMFLHTQQKTTKIVRVIE